MGTIRGPCVWPCALGTGRGALAPSGTRACAGAVSSPGRVLPGDWAVGRGAVTACVSCSTTHWKQVLFMMDEPVPVLVGDVVTGSVVLQRNPVWRRHMSVTLSWSVTSGQDPTSQRVRRSAGQSRAVVLVRAASGDHSGGRGGRWASAFMEQETEPREVELFALRHESVTGDPDQPGGHSFWAPRSPGRALAQPHTAAPTGGRRATCECGVGRAP